MNKLLNIVVLAGMVGMARASCDVEAINPVSAREATNYRYIKAIENGRKPLEKRSLQYLTNYQYSPYTIYAKKL